MKRNDERGTRNDELKDKRCSFIVPRLLMRLPRLYPITDARLSGLSHAEQVERLCDGGATLVQLREKHLSPREFYREAAEALRVARARGARLVINDRADIALAVGADGLHLGQDDLRPDAARQPSSAMAPVMSFS